ncbi:glycosyl transferase, family 9 [Afipia carboxidovorans OM5]|uniref:Heptosyltransferase family protein n=1 Tax=Afipia carboxidovorans (strain ATCC 49405 / DSM 1227 / KCTC 32145 / OM5) TaxID=504832 RepID=B6JHY7_AFIC5|nr:glycosyltransferase family 9 protein [Afipia carboxidovorans]ACI92654.1 glycosyl transferase, family 9 [Afipia carboxidovorans OM5]AEI03587.1 heptosyltransferase family protein [Afipia carboxidovorans OM4]AEI07164.1 heptosyltransferase family protein [Afipia carboxidovorans OM5]
MALSKPLRKLFRKLGKNRQKLDLTIEARRSRKLPRDKGSVVVVRLDGIGDFVLWLACARAIRVRYPQPDYRITLIASSVFSNFAASTGLFDDVIAVDTKRYIDDNTYSRSILKRVAALRAEVAINPGISRDRYGDRLVHVSGATTRIGVDGDPKAQTEKKQQQSDLWYTDLIRITPGIHEIEANAIVARTFDPAMPPRRPRLDKSLIARPDWLPDESYFVVFPGSASVKKKWPAERFAAILQRLQQRTGWIAVICGTNAEKRDAQAILDLTGRHRIVDACGRTDLPALAGVLRDAKLLLCNDTGAAHIAAAVDTPVVVPCGGYHYGRFLPYPTLATADTPVMFAVFEQMPCFNCSWKCIYPRADDEPLYCVSQIGIEAVWDAVSRALNITPQADAR